jgi:hypothetical protein
MDEPKTTEEIRTVEPTEVIPAPRKLIDGGNVIILVGDERGQTPMPLPAVFQQLFAVLGDLDRRLTALEEKAKSAIVRLN